MKTTNNETNAEQLKRVKRLVEYDIERAFYHDLDLEKGLSLLEKLYEHLDIEWLLEQAERVSELDKLGELKASYIKTINQQSYENGVLKEENKRFREALKFYANPEEYDLDKEGANAHFVEHCHIMECGIGGKAKQVLEGDKTNETDQQQ